MYREPLCLHVGVTSCSVTSQDHVREHYLSFTAHPGSCASPNPSRRFRFLIRRVSAGCCQPLPGDGPSRLYLCNPFTVAWPPTPQRFFGAITRFFPKNIGLTSGLNSSAHCTPPESNSYQGSSISGLQAFLYVQASVIARPPGCSHPVTNRSQSS